MESKLLLLPVNSLPTARTALCAFALGVMLLADQAQEVPSLTLQQAHEAALRNHPRISVAQLTALATREVTREVRAGFFPNLSANTVAVGSSENNTRLGAVGTLNSPHVFDRTAEGVMVSQLITDFGRTANLSQSAQFHARAAEQNLQATREQILLAVDGAFYSAQQAQAVTRVAQQTVTARQTFLDQVTALASNKLRSDLDVSFARVNVEDARLLLSKAQNDLQADFTLLANLMGSTEPKAYRLVEEPLPSALSTHASEYVQQALRARPDLHSARDEQEAALKFARAEKALRYPTVAAIGAAGLIPIHDPELPDYYAAAGLTLSLPIYAGGLYSARQEEAALRAQAAAQAVRDAEDNVIRDVRVAWLSAQNAFDRWRISGQLLENAKQSYDLAQARYNAGLSGIVELNQAQLNEVAAEIAYANTQYEYLIQRSDLSYQTGALR